jgi:RHS repeat-associated protein
MNMQGQKQIKTRHQISTRLGLSLLLFVILVGTTVESLADVFPKSGIVITRGLVLGPNDKPIYSEIDAGGAFINDIGEVTGPYEKARVLSGDSYRGLYQHFTLHKQAHAGDQAYSGATVMTADDYKGTDLGSVKVPKVNWNGQGESYSEVAIPKIDLPDSVKSVLVRNKNTVVDPNLLPPGDGSILFRAPIDLRAGQLRNLGSDVRSVLIGDKGEVLYTSAHNIGFKAAFYTDKQGNPHDSIRRDPGEDTILGPVSGAKVEPSMGFSMGPAYTDEEGKFRTNFYIVPCPGFAYSAHFYFNAELFYRMYDPENPRPVGQYFFKRDYYHYCSGYHLRAPGLSLVGLMAQVAAIGIHATTAIPYNPVEIYVDVVQLGGLGQLVSSNGIVPIGDTTEYEYTPPPGTKVAPGNLDLDNDRNYDTVTTTGDSVGVYLGDNRPVDANGQPVEPDLVKVADTNPDWHHQGLLKGISETDFKETDLYFYRASNGVLITKIEGLEHPYAVRDPKKLGISRSTNSFYYRVRIPGEFATKNTYRFITGSRQEWQDALGLPPELSGRRFDALRPGEEIKIIAINRPTGYIGTQIATIRPAGQGFLDFNTPPIIMRAPNLKIRAERIYTVEAGLTKDEKRTYQIGFEGSALTSDTMISLETEWFDHDGMPLPEDLEGYTGRLAKVTSPNSVEGGEVQQFKIEPGKHLEVVKFKGDILGTEHFYVHVSGYPEWRSAGVGAGDGPLRYRPKNYVPFMVPILDETATRELRNKARYAKEDGLSDTSKADPIYHWPYRPEMQFSVFQFLVNELNVKTEFDPILQRATTKVDLDYQLNDARLPPLERFGALRQLLFELGYSELAAEFGSDQETTFEDILGLFARHPELASRISSEDYLTLQLADNADTENKLYELVYVPLISASASPFSLTRTIHQGQFNQAQSNAGDSDISDSFKVFNFSVTQPSKVEVLVLDQQHNEQSRLLREKLLVPGQYHFVLTYEQIEGMGLLPRSGTDFYINIKARAVDDFGHSDSYVHDVEIPGDLRLVYRGEMLGQIIQHNVKVQTVALNLQRSDFVLKGRGPDLEFSRSYSNAGSGDDDSMLGEGWSHNWGIQLRGLAWTGDTGRHYIPQWIENNRNRFLRPEQLQPDPTSLTLVSVGNGGIFKKQGGTWYAQRGHHGTLVETASGFTFTSKDGTKYEFQSPIGRQPMPLLAVVDRNGNRMEVEQEQYFGIGQTLNRVTKVTDAVGRTINFNYGTVGSEQRLLSVTASSGVSVAYHYDPKGLLTAVVRQPAATPAGGPPIGESIEKYSYTQLVADDDHNITSITDPNNHTTVYTFNTPGGLPAAMGSFVQELKDEEVVKTVKYPGSNPPHTFSYSFTNGNVRTVTDGRGNTTEYLLNYFGNPLEIREPQGKVTKMTWTIDQGTDDNLITSRTDALGRTYTYDYDDKGNVTKETDSTGKSTISVWNQTYSLLKSRTDRNGVTISRTYDASNGDLLTATNGDGFTTEFTYYGTGELKTAKDPLGNITAYTYDSRGNPASIKQPETDASITEYDVRGRLTLKKDPKGYTTTFDYDSLDRLISQKDPDGRISTFDYDAKGNKTREVNRYGVTLAYTYDARDRVDYVTRSGPGINTAVQDFDYDGNSNLILESDWKGLVTRHSYNELNQRKTTTNRLSIIKSMDYDLVGNKITDVDYNGHISTYHYDDLDRLDRVTQTGSPEDKVTEHGYDFEKNLKWTLIHNTPDNQLTQFDYNNRYLRTDKTNAEGDVYHWEYDQAGNLDWETNEGTGRTEYEYDGNNRKKSERRFHASGQSYTTGYQYDDNSNVEVVTDPRGNTVTTTYDELNRPKQVTDQRGEQTVYQYQDGGLHITVTDARNIARITQKDSLERVVRQTQGDGGDQRFEYDENSNQTEATDGRGFITSIVYDSMDRPKTITEALGAAHVRVSEKQYDNLGNVIAEIAPRYSAAEPALTTSYIYDEFNQLKTVTAPAPFSYIQSYTYDQAGNKKTHTDRRGNLTSYDYSNLNQLVKVTGPASFNYTQSYSYYPSGTVETETDKRGHTTTHYYDSLDRLILSEKPDGLGNVVKLVRNEYDGNNNVTKITDAVGNEINTSFTPRNQPWVTTYADNTSTTRSYDAVGNLEDLIDENNKTTHNTYDGENRLASVTNPKNETTSYSYDKNGNKETTTKPLGLQWDYDYDGLNRLTQVKDALSNTTAYQYDARNNLTRQTDAKGKQVDYHYDQLNRRDRHVQVKDTGDLTVSYGYDANGNRTSVTDAMGQAFNYTYDELNRLSTTSLPVSSGPYLNLTQTVQTYDANGNLDTVTETKTGTSSVTDVTSHSHDHLDRLSSTTQRGVTVSYGYDLNGNRTSVTSPAGSTTYTYYPRNQVKTTVTADGTTNFDYYPDTRKKTVIHPNGTQTLYTYENAYRVDTVTTSKTADGSVISQYDYAYDSNGNRIEQQETQAGQPETTAYQYDAADRLSSFTITKADATSETTDYGTLDPVGNRLAEVKTNNIGTTLVDRNYSYDDTHWVSKIVDNLKSADIDYSYDANGNTRQKVDNTKASPESTKFVYNSRDQLVQTQRGPPGSETAVLGQYDYNYKGQRIRHLQSSRGDVNYYYDQDAVLEEHNGAGGLLAHYRYADKLISMNTGTDTQFYHLDALGSTTNLTKTDGSLQVSYRLDPWGQIREQVGSSVNRQIFTGQEHDENTGLIYFGARYYDPDVGRFITQDSYLGRESEPPSLHRYLYAGGRPTYYVDEDGRCFGLCTGAVVAYLAYTAANAAVDTASDVAIDEGVNALTGQESTTTLGGTAKAFAQNFAGDLVTAGVYGKVKKIKKVKKLAEAANKAYQKNKTAQKVARAAEKASQKVDDVASRVVDKAKLGKGKPKITKENPKGPSDDSVGAMRVKGSKVETEQQIRERLKIKYGRADLNKDINKGAGYKKVDQDQQGNYTSDNYPNPDPEMSAPPVKRTPESFDEIKRMRESHSPKGPEHEADAIEAHHRQQKSVEYGDGKIDELTRRTHRQEGNHTRHDRPSEMTDYQRSKETRAHYKERGYEYKLPEDDY